MARAYLYCKSGEFGARDSGSFLADLSLYSFDKSILPVAMRDMDLIRGLIESSPDAVLDIALRLQEGDAKRTFEIAEEIGLTERAFKARGGGWPGLLFVAVLALVVLTPRKLDDPEPHAPSTWGTPGIEPPPLKPSLTINSSEPSIWDWIRSWL